MQGRDGVKTMLNENPEMMAALNHEVREAMGLEVAKSEAAPATNGETKKEKKAKA
jgi:hypothetical protein